MPYLFYLLRRGFKMGQLILQEEVVFSTMVTHFKSAAE